MTHTKTGRPAIIAGERMTAMNISISNGQLEVLKEEAYRRRYTLSAFMRELIADWQQGQASSSPVD